MIALGGHNQLGNVLHMIVGPESELHIDLHGAKVLDITPILVAMNPEERVFVSVTRCRSESQLINQLTSSDVTFLNSFAGLMKAQPQLPAASSAKPAEPTVKKGRCAFCGKPDTELLPIPGFKICSDCAQLELRRNAQKVDQIIKDAASDTGAPSE